MDGQVENTPESQAEPRTNRALWMGLFSLVWCLAIILGYYVMHKPLNAAMAVSLGLAVWRIAVAVILTSLAGGLGCSIEGFDNFQSLAKCALQAGLGFGIIGLGVLLIGLTIGLSIPVLGVLVIILTLFLRQSIATWWGDLLTIRQVWSGGNRLSKFFLIYIAVLLVLGLITALAAPLSFDALVYHLSMPQTYLQAGHISGLPWLMYSGMPQQAEMIYTLAAVFGGVQASAVVGCMMGAMALIGLIGFGLQSMRLTGAISGAAVLVSGFSLAVSLGAAYDEWPAMLFGLGFLICLDAWAQNGHVRQLVFTGVFAGFALGSRYTAGILLVCGIIVIAWQSVREQKNPLSRCLIFGGAATLVTLLWWVKNWIFTSNPFYPLLFPSGSMTAGRLAVFQHAAPWGDWTDIFLLPFKATLTGVEGAPGYAFSMGPMLLALACLAWLGFRARTVSSQKTLATMGIVSVSGVLIWIIGNRFSGFLIQTRMYTPLFPAICILAGTGFEGLMGLKAYNIRFGRILGALVGLVLFLNLIEVGALKVQQDPLKSLLALESQSQYTDRNLGWFAPAMRAVTDLPAGSKTLLLFEPRSFYCSTTCSPDESMDVWQRELASSGGNLKSILVDWKGAGYTHVLYYKAGADFMRDTNDAHHTPAEWQSLSKFIDTLPAPVDFGGAYELYSLP